MKVQTVMPGPGPSEAIVAIDKKEGGQEEVVVNRRLICNDTIEVAKIRTDKESVLVELPQEPASGMWRIRVDSANFI